MSTETRLLRSWMAELAATEHYIRTSLASAFAPDAVRRVEADAVAVGDELLSRSGFDPDDVAFATGWWQAPPLPSGDERISDEHTDELLTAAVSAAPAHLEPGLEAEAELEPELGVEDFEAEFTGEEAGDAWITYEEVAEEKPTDEVSAAGADAWIQYDEEQPTSPGLRSASKTMDLSAEGAPTPRPAADRLPTARPEAEPRPPAAAAAAKYMTHDDPGDDVSVHDEDEDEITGVFDRRPPQDKVPGAPMAPAAKADTGDPFQADADSAVTLDVELEPEETSPTPVPERASRYANLDPRAGEATQRAAQEIDEFDLVVDEEEISNPITEDEFDAASDAEVVATSNPRPTTRAAIAPPRAPEPAPSAQVRTAAVRAAAAPEARVATPRAAAAPSPRATAGLYGSAAVPTIRDNADPRPKAAAIQINAQAGSGKVIGLEEEEEPLEIGSAEDYGEEEPDVEPASDGGFRIALQEYEDVEIEEEDEEAPEEQTATHRAIQNVPTGPTPAEIAGMLAKARAAEEAGLLDEGIALYADVIDADPDTIDARVGRGRLYLDRGDFARAMSDFMVAEEIGPQHPEPQIAIGDLHFARKDYRKAIDYFDLALTLAPKSAKAFCRRGISHYWRKAYPHALADLSTAQKLDPETANIGTYITMVKKKMKK